MQGGTTVNPLRRATVKPLAAAQWSLSPEGRTRIPFPLASFKASPGEWKFSAAALNAAGAGPQCTTTLKTG